MYPIKVLKLTVTVFTSLTFLTLWPNWPNFSWSCQQNSVSDQKIKACNCHICIACGCEDIIQYIDFDQYNCQHYISPHQDLTIMGLLSRWAYNMRSFCCSSPSKWLYTIREQILQDVTVRLCMICINKQPIHNWVCDGNLR